MKKAIVVLLIKWVWTCVHHMQYKLTIIIIYRKSTNLKLISLSCYLILHCMQYCWYTFTVIYFDIHITVSGKYLNVCFIVKSPFTQRFLFDIIFMVLLPWLDTTTVATSLLAVKGWLKVCVSYVTHTRMLKWQHTNTCTQLQTQKFLSTK